MINAKYIVIIIVAVFAFAMPIGLVIWWKKKTGEKLWPFIAGAICFTVFAMVLENLLHSVMINPATGIGKTITSSAVLYSLYGGFAAGIFEETGRLFGFKVLLKNHKEKECAVAYGIGHGGIEVIMLLGATYIMYVLAIISPAILGQSTTEQIKYALNSVQTFIPLVAMLERCSAVILHIGLSMLVFVAAKQKGKIYLYFIAIILHAFVDFPAVLTLTGINNSLAVLEGFVLFLAVAVFLVGRMVLKNYAPAQAESQIIADET